MNANDEMPEDGVFNDPELDLLHDYLSQESDETEFMITRETEDGFEENELDQLHSDIRTFISARIIKKWNEDGAQPGRVIIKISLDIA